MEAKRGKSKRELAQELVINIDFKPKQKKPRPNRDTKILAFFAEKGGVGKTTLCINLAYTFAEKGKRVLIYDCDVQRSLTAWVFGNNIEAYHETQANKLDNFIKSILNNIDTDKFSLSLADQVLDINSDLKPAFAAKLHNELYVVVGSRKLIDLEEQISHTEGFCNAFSMPKLNMPKMPNQVSGKIYHSIMKTAEYYDIDYVFVDMNPYPGSFVRCLLMSSHYVIIPSCLDYFCLEMMHNMADNFTRWEKATRKNAEFTKLPGGNYPWPDHFPKFLGFILNIFSNSANLTETDDLVAMQDDVFWATEKTSEITDNYFIFIAHK
jgi:chromosome partitioning protein